MYKVNRRKNGRNNFGRGWGAIFPTFPPKNRRIWGDLGGGGAPGGALVGVGEGGVGGWGRKRPTRAQYIGLVAPARLALTSSITPHVVAR